MFQEGSEAARIKVKKVEGVGRITLNYYVIPSRRRPFQTCFERRIAAAGKPQAFRP